MGRWQIKLEEYGVVRGLVIGAFGDVSEGLNEQEVGKIRRKEGWGELLSEWDF